MKQEEWVNSITIDMIPEQYQDIACEIGILNLIKLAQITGGRNVYIPKQEFFTRMLRDRLIRQEFNGYNYHQLEKKFDLSYTRIREILSENNPMDGQMNFFESNAN